MLPVVHLGPFSFYTFGLVFGASVCLGWALFARYFRLHALPVNEPLLGTCLVVFGFAGAKLDNAIVNGMLVTHGQGSLPTLLGQTRGGYTYLGCVLGGWLAGAAYGYLNKLPLLRFFDALFCIGPAYAIGRIGCFLAGDGDYGVPSTVPWAVSFPHGIVPTVVRVHPTMLYCTVWELAVFAILWKVSSAQRRPPLRPGMLLGLYLIATSVGRFLVEFLSRNRTFAFGLTEAQLVSIALILTGTVIIVSVLMKVPGARPLYSAIQSEYE